MGTWTLSFTGVSTKKKESKRTSRFALSVKNTTVLKSLSPIIQHRTPEAKGWDDDCLA